jgi:nitrous oxidase accessory protein
MAMDGSLETFALISLLLMTCACNVLLIRTVKAGSIWTVDDNGPGIRSIQIAINMADDGDTILVRSGIYYEQIVVNKTLSIIGEDQGTTIVDGSYDGIVFMIAAPNITVRGLTIQHGLAGIMLQDGKEGNTIFRNKIWSNEFFGIYGDRCGETVIADNNVSLNGKDGIFMYAGEPCVLDNNSILSNGDDGMRIRYSSSNTITRNLVSYNVNGIHIWSDEDPFRPSGLSRSNVIEDNHVLNNYCGIKVDYFGPDVTAARNEIRDNLVAQNYVGLNISGSNGNTIYHNNFINNSKEVSIYDSSNNTWNEGYYFGGNYWSDHNSTDLYWGSSQNETGSDGIVDTPYIVSPNPGEEDRYPFKYAGEWLALPEQSVTSPLNKTYRSNTLPLALNTNKPVWIWYTLDNQTTVTVVNNLILTDLPVGRHIITVYVNDTLGSEVSSEVMFTVTLLADLSLDGMVNIIDITIVARSYGSSLGSEGWNSEADLDNNGVINIVDVAIAAKEYGKRI